MTAPAATIVMYHYVRPIRGSRFPGLKGLEVDAFIAQLTYLQRHYVPMNLRDVVEATRNGEALPPNACVLTFDDGYLDHWTYVAPILDEMGLPGVFYPVSLGTVHREMLDVHRIQFILAAVEDAETLLPAVMARIEATPGLDAAALMREHHTATRFDSAGVAFVKRMLQFALPEDVRHALAVELFARYVTADEHAFAEELYLTPAQSRALARHGFEVGSQGHEHIWLGRSDAARQREDIETSLALLESCGVPRQDFSFCYPYGSLTEETVAVVRSLGAASGVATRVDIAKVPGDDLLTLPRLDTNDLPKDAAAAPNEWTRAVLG